MTLEEYKQKFYSKFPDSKLKLIKLLPNYYVEVENEFGICNMYVYNLLKGVEPCIETSTNKLEYYKNQYFINHANKIHNYKYNYSNINYITTHCKISIYCNIHNELFLQTPAAHLQGSGCPLCRNDYNSIYNSENSTGWSCTNWESRSKISKNFDSFKLYIIECWNKNEKFFKIGRTFQLVENRFKSNIEMPYKFKILKIEIGNAREIFELEWKLKNENKEYKYIPLIRFHGSKECYSKIKQDETTI